MDNTTIINAATGTLRLAEGFCVSPDTPLDEVLSAQAKYGLTVTEVGSRSVHAIVPFQCGVTAMSIRVIFLDAVLFMAIIESTDYALADQARKSWHDSWLQGQIGDPPYEYEWGTVTSEISPRDGNVNIVLNYRPAR